MYYEESNRGKNQFHERANQEIDFSGIKYGRITPTSGKLKGFKVGKEWRINKSDLMDFVGVKEETA